MSIVLPLKGEVRRGSFSVFLEPNGKHKATPPCALPFQGREKGLLSPHSLKHYIERPGAAVVLARFGDSEDQRT